MAVLQMLAEMIGSIELLGLVALSELVDVGKVIDTAIPVGRWVIGKLLTTESTCISQAGATSMCRRMEDGFKGAHGSA